MHRITVAIAVTLSVCAWTANAQALTFSVDQPPNGSLITDGALLQFTTTLDGTPDATRSILVGTPVDALHIGAPEGGLINATFDTIDREILNWIWTGHLALSLDDGDPFPIGVSPDRDREVWVAAPYAPAVPANGNSLKLAGDMNAAIEPNLGLGPNYAFDDDVDGLDTKVAPDLDTETVFFSIDDRISLVPNLTTDMQTQDIFARFTDGGVAKVIDGVVDLGLVHDGDGAGIRVNDDVDAMILLNLDDCETNNVVREIVYQDAAGATQVAFVDLGDAVLFSLDNGSNPAYHDLPYQNAGTGPNHYQASMDTAQIYLSTYNGMSLAVRSHASLGLMVGDPCCYWDDIDALAVGDEVPEPGTLVLIGTAALTMVGVVRRRRLKA